LFGYITPNQNGGLLHEILWGTLGVLGPLSIIFLWSGMRKYQQMKELRNPDLIARPKNVRICLAIGVCYAAMIYFLFVYLPERHKSAPGTEGLEKYVS
jgi:hypothetical protein